MKKEEPDPGLTLHLTLLWDVSGLETLEVSAENCSAVAVDPDLINLDEFETEINVEYFFELSLRSEVKSQLK